ncbi:MAG: hypothetical protein WAS07_03540 [Micropruina sp.]|nr:hypothetical protein [Micropruina sp.]
MSQDEPTRTFEPYPRPGQDVPVDGPADPPPPLPAHPTPWAAAELAPAPLISRRNATAGGILLAGVLMIGAVASGGMMAVPMRMDNFPPDYLPDEYTDPPVNDEDTLYFRGGSATVPTGWKVADSTDTGAVLQKGESRVIVRLYRPEDGADPEAEVRRLSLRHTGWLTGLTELDGAIEDVEGSSGASVVYQGRSTSSAARVEGRLLIRDGDGEAAFGVVVLVGADKTAAARVRGFVEEVLKQVVG